MEREVSPREGLWTPGPWEPGCFVNPDSKCHCSYIFSDGYNGSVAQVSVDNERFIQHGGNDSPKLIEARANARLIAAAPEMFQQLREARSILNSCGFEEPPDEAYKKSWDEALARIDAVLSKASPSLTHQAEV